MACTAPPERREKAAQQTEQDEHRRPSGATPAHKHHPVNHAVHAHARIRAQCKPPNPTRSMRPPLLSWLCARVMLLVAAFGASQLLPLLLPAMHADFVMVRVPTLSAAACRSLAASARWTNARLSALHPRGSFPRRNQVPICCLDRDTESTHGPPDHVIQLP